MCGGSLGGGRALGFPKDEPLGIQLWTSALSSETRSEVGPLVRRVRGMLDGVCGGDVERFPGSAGEETRLGWGVD